MAVEIAVRKDLREPRMGEFRLRRHHHARGILVEAVDDPRPALAADAGEAVAAMGEQGVHQRALVVAGRGMDDEPRRLVEHDEVGILVEDGERDVLRLRGGGDGFRHCQGIGHAGLHGFGRVAHGHVTASCHPVQDQVLDPRAGEGREALGQEAVEALALMIRRRDHRIGEGEVVVVGSGVAGVALLVIRQTCPQVRPL